MTTLVAVENVQEKSVGIDLMPRLTRLWAAALRRLDDHRTLHRLYQLDAHALRDMGFDPDDIYAAYEGAIGELPGRRSRGRWAE